MEYGPSISLNAHKPTEQRTVSTTKLPVYSRLKCPYPPLGYSA